MPPKKEIIFESLENVGVHGIQKLKWILNHWDSLPLRAKTKQASEERYSPLEIMSSYIKMSKRGCVNVKYHHSKHGVGRLMANLSRSLQNMPREVRHTIAKDNYIDIDITNAHPTFLYQYCKKMNIPCKYLQHYIEHRESCIQEILDCVSHTTRDDVKSGILAMTNGGAGLFTSGILSICPEWVSAYKGEMTGIHEAIMQLEPTYAEMGLKNAKDKKAKGGFFNPTGSAVNLLLCDIENKVLMTMVNYLKQQGLSVAHIVLVFDGLMLFKKDLLGHDVSKLLEGMEEAVRIHNGYDVKIVEKPMDEGFKLPEDYQVNTDDQIIIRNGEEEASMLLYDMVKGYVRKCMGVVYIRKDGVWLQDPTSVEDALLLTCMQTPFVKLSQLGEIQNYSCNLSSAKAIVRTLMARIPEDDMFKANMKATTKCRLVWKDGYYDFRTKLFTKGFEGVDSVIQIPRDYPLQRDSELEQEIYMRLLYPIFGGDTETGLSPLGKSTLSFLARAIAGHIEDKRWAVGLGERNSGKGTLCEILSTAFCRYVDTFQADNMLGQRIHGGDEAKKYSWMFRMEHSRIVYTNEITFEKNVKMDGNCIKRLCSGGDRIEARKNYENEQTFTIGATPIFFCNALPIVSPTDAYETMYPIPFPHKFVPHVSEGSPAMMKVGDPTIKEFCQRADVGDAFFHILTDYYVKTLPGMCEEQKELMQDYNEENELDAFLKKFTFTGKKSDEVPISEVYDAMDCMNVSKQQVKLMLLRRGAKEGRITTKDRKTVRVFTGMVMVNDNND